MNLQEYYDIIVKKDMDAAVEHPISRKILTSFNISESTKFLRVTHIDYDSSYIFMLWMYYRFTDPECLKLYPDTSSISETINECGGVEGIGKIVDKYKEYYDTCKEYFKALINDPSDICFVRFIPNEHGMNTLTITRVKDKFLVSEADLGISDKLNDFYADIGIFGKFILIYYDNKLE